ncbi:hypothetical protein Scep_008718 [Stephania cephalantha]|uniref:Glabrous enhancer-binding protein-like DBD domain-containing protein n=1 Tax=Stephania cephalantha TaxID=152367 RepID=A0AAP0JU71_9MAGN
MSSANGEGEDRIMYDDGEEDEEEDLEEEESDDDDEEDDEEDEEDLNSDAAATVTIAAAAGSSDAAAATAISAATTVLNGPSEGSAAAPPAFSDVTPDPKRMKIEEPSPSVATEERKPLPLDDSRRLFQRLWTDEDEIGLLQGFLEYTTQRGLKNSVYHHDTAPFYDQIKTRLQLDFNKNQLVEKLRRLKKKYRNVMARITSGKDFNFKSPHDQATFEISRKIWSEVTPGAGDAGMEDEEGNPLNAEINDAAAVAAINNNGIDVGNSEKKVVQRSRKRAKKRVEEEPVVPNPSNLLNCPVNSSIPNVVEDTVRSCLSPLFKELLQCAINGPCNVRGLGGLGALNPLPLNFGGTSSLNLLNGEKVDEKWRKQQILELEVYSKRLELVQDQIKSALEELRSSGGR